MNALRVDLLLLEATLAPHPGINRTYRSTSSGDRWYKTDAVSLWAERAMLELRRAGFRIQPHGCYFIALFLVLHTRRQDVDAPLKGVIDTVCSALGVDDTYVGELHVVKVPAQTTADQRLEIRAIVEPLTGETTWEQRASESARGEPWPR